MTSDVRIDLTPIVREVNRVGQQLDMAVSAVSADIGSLQQDMASTRGDILELRALFEEFIVQAERTAAVQRSETVLGNLEAELDREYGHYKAVRRTSVGTLQAFDIGNVTNRTVQQVSEELMIQTPRYWLAPALVGLAAWSRDDAELAEKSIAAAFDRDPAKTGLFFALVLRRQGRSEAATRWLRHYLGSLDPRMLTREFAVILEATGQDAFGAHGRELVAAQLLEWNEQLRSDPAVTAKQVDEWVEEMRIHRGTLDNKLYPNLAALSPQWTAFKDLLEGASANRNVIAKYQAVRGAHVALTADTSDRLDEILEMLVTEFDEEELPYAREVLFHRAVIEHNGDVTRARETADAETTALDESLDLVTLQTQIALRPELLAVSTGTQQIAVGIGREDFVKAIAVYSGGYRRNYLDAVDLVFGPQHSTFAANLGFPGWQVNTNTPQGEGEQSLVNTWGAAMQAYLERVRFKPITAVIPALIAVVLTFIGFLVGVGAGLVMLLLGGGGAAGYVWWKKREADKLYNEAVRTRDQAIAFSVDMYRAAIAEFVDAKLAYREEDQQVQSLTDLIKSWPTTVGHRAEAVGA
ncbi:hypothetical protein ACFQNE_05755 [Gordonia phosphorivorans]|uniref:Uncharacterized protein n=1 Tax=Gordonia phosphorivorans TaxID=1056982 RepID=A0ABV6H528_9ACTN